MRSRALLLLVACLVAVPAPAYAAGQTPPDLPSVVTEGCTGPSPVTVEQAPWSQRMLAPETIWPVTRGAGVLVAVLDTGVSASAPALRGAVQAKGGAGTDCYGRGTALAGIVAARPTDGTGFAGMAPAATVLPVRVIDSDGKVTADRLAAALRAATSAHARIILVGTGVPSPTPALTSAVRDAVAHDALVVASAGSPVLYPAAYPQVLTVGAVDATGQATASAGRVDLTAPGAGTYSIAPAGAGHYAVSGAPVAAAYVAGAAALVRAYHPGWTQTEVRARLLSTARSTARTLDAYAAVTALVVPGEPTAAPGLATLTIPARPATPRSTVVALLTALAALLVGAVAVARRR